MTAGALVSIVMGSRNDEAHVEKTIALLERLGIPWEKTVLSAHRQPDALGEFVAQSANRGVRIFIAVAGLSAALPGVIASHTPMPVIGVPVPTGPLHGMDALLAMVQMPGGIPVATVGLGSNGSVNAAVLAAQILAPGSPAVKRALDEYRQELREA